MIIMDLYKIKNEILICSMNKISLVFNKIKKNKKILNFKQNKINK